MRQPESLHWTEILLLLFLAGVLLDSSWLVFLSVGLAVTGGLAHLWRVYALRQVMYRRHWRYRRGFPAETLTVRVEVENRKPLPLSWLRVEDPWPLAIAPEPHAADAAREVTDAFGELAPSHLPEMGTLVNAYSLRWFQRAQRTYTLRLRARGIYPVGPARLESGDLFGLFTSRREGGIESTAAPAPEFVTVFPQLLPLEALHLPPQDPFGDRRSRYPLFEDPTQTMGVRDYTPGDSFRRIHWAATARCGVLQTRVYQPVTARVLAICLNVATQRYYWLGHVPEVLEYLVQACATLVYEGIQAGYAVGLYSNGCLAHSDQPFRISPGRTPGQLAALLGALAGVTPIAVSPFETFLVQTLPKIPFGATLMLLSAQQTPELSDVICRLKIYRSHTTLLTLDAAGEPEIPGIRRILLAGKEITL